MKGKVLTKREYLELSKIKEKLEDILRIEKEEKKKRVFESAFGLLKNSFEGKDSLDYVTELRKEWRNDRRFFS